MIWRLNPRFPSEGFTYLIEVFSPCACWVGLICEVSPFRQYLHFVWLPDNQARAMFYLRSVEAFVNFFGFSPAKCWVWFKIPIRLISCCNVWLLNSPSCYPHEVSYFFPREVGAILTLNIEECILVSPLRCGVGLPNEVSTRSPVDVSMMKRYLL